MPSKSKSRNKPVRQRRRSVPLRKASTRVSSSRCPKCGGKMVNAKCTKCNFSPKTAYVSREQAKEYTHQG